MSEWYAETDSDFNNYFDLKAHGVSAVFTNTGGTAKTIQIILNEEYIDVQPDGTGITILILQEN
jgi:hypothetical protein